MTWFKVDDAFHSHPKVLACSLAARGLWVTAGSYCAQQLTDGFIPDAVVRMHGGTRIVRELDAAGLWERVPGGWQFHEWTSCQPSRSEVRSRREAATQRQRRSRVTHAPVTRDNTGDVTRDSHASTDQARALTRPDPTRSSEPSQQAAQVPRTSSQTLVTEWIDHCAQRPPSRVIGQVSKELAALADDGFGPDALRSALAEWHRKGLHPSSLASVVHEHINAPPRQSTTDTRVQGALALAAKFAEQDHQ